eukprot:GFYU01001689.1.p1 GENE.GFYU01001689.1~~GFYU01001689.1.p1  ORF type:complete len:262 (-),score=96.84 GFYU01001689.1:279-953(-)
MSTSERKGSTSSNSGGDSVVRRLSQRLSLTGDPFAEEGTPGYQVSDAAKVDLATTMNKDADDEALQKWKRDLLGAAADGAAGGGDGRQVVIKTLRFVFTSEEKSMEWDLSTPEAVEKFKKEGFVLKEGSKYRPEVDFVVSNDVVAGFKYGNVVYRSGIKVDKDNIMMGSYGPKAEPQKYVFKEVDVPSGMLARGNYTAKSKFFDDDGNTHLEYEYTFSIKKNWE